MVSSEKSKEYAKRIYFARLRLIAKNPFYGMLLMHVSYGLDEFAPTAYTDGERICFSPRFLDKLNEDELDLVLMHELMHIVLEHCGRGVDLDAERYNIACDIVVNSNILSSLGGDVKKITIRSFGELIHKTPNGDEGHKYTAEEVYAMLDKQKNAGQKKNSGSGGEKKDKKGENPDGSERASGRSFDTHDKWKRSEGADADFESALWAARIKEAARIAEKRGGKSAGAIPAGIEILLKELGEAQLDWRRELIDFVQEEVNDYSFSPPDRRYDGDFFLPDFNESEFVVKNILFMIDTSASMSEGQVNDMYSEIYGAIGQFGGKLEGYVGFFDAEVIPPVPFMDEDEFRAVRAYGGGGTSFQAVFDHINEQFKEPLSAIVILTDGFAPFPMKKDVPPVPLLWVINNKTVDPPYGRVLRIK